MTTEPADAGSIGSGRRLIFLVTEDWYFWSHRLPMARAAQAAGFRVGVAARFDRHAERIRAAGFDVLPLRWRRGSLGPLASLAAILEIRRLYRRERPVIVHHVALKPALLGGIAALLARVPATVSLVAGMGFAGGSRSGAARLAGGAGRRILPRLLLRRHARAIVQNPDDRRALAALAPGAADRIHVIPGSGVDLAQFQPAPEPRGGPVTAAYVGRMIGIKGIATLVEAQQRLQRRGVDLRLLLIGPPDPENPTSIPLATLQRWSSLPGIDWRGRQEDIAGVWRQAHIAVMASDGGEGLPKSLLEAAAMARPIVATDVPGNREIARHGVNALLVPPGDPEALADALAVLAGDPAQRRRLGAAGRDLVERDMSDQAIAAATASVYRALVAELADAAGAGNQVSIRPSSR
jgi:glycosyltransferase involved in cell wall biosynthesis